MTVPAIIGKAVGQTQTLLSSCMTSRIEGLIRACVKQPYYDLRAEYQAIRKLGAESQSHILSHPLFALAADQASANVEENNLEKSCHAAAILRSLRLDATDPVDDWLVFNEHGFSTLPFSAIVLQSPAASSFRIVRNNGELIATLNGQEHPISKQCEFFASKCLPGGKWFASWRLPNKRVVVDPLTRGYRLSVPENWQTETPNPHRLEEWQTVLDDCFGILNQCEAEGILKDLAVLARVIVPIHNQLVSSHLSSSCPAAPGVICMSFTGNPLQIMEALVHEAGHHKLFLIERLDQLTTSSEAIYQSPWRSDLRPARGLIHGAYSFAGVANLWRVLLGSGKLSSHHRPAVEMALHTSTRQVKEALEVLQTTDVLTQAGREIVDCLSSDITAVLVPGPRSIPERTRSNPDALGYEEPDSQKILGEIAVKFPMAGALAQDVQAQVGEILRCARIASSLTQRSLKIASTYCLRWALPLAEASGLPLASEVLRRWMAVQVLLGLMWRYSDDHQDEHSEDHMEQLALRDAATAMLVSAACEMKSLARPLTGRLRRLLFQFQRYRAVEIDGSPSPEEIWRRASSFLVVPAVLLARLPERRRAFQAYVHLLGMIDDIQDAWLDFASGRYTWVTPILATRTPSAVSRELQAALAHQRQALSYIVEERFPVWHWLLNLAFSEGAAAIVILKQSWSLRQSQCK